MKRPILIFIFSLAAVFGYAQEQKIGGAGEHTATTWENICFTSKNYVYAKLSSADGKINLRIKHMPLKKKPKEYRIDRGDKFILYLADSTTVTTYAPETFYSSTGAGAVGHMGTLSESIYPVYPIRSEDAELLKVRPIKRIKMKTSMGSVKFDLKDDKKEAIRQMFGSVAD